MERKKVKIYGIIKFVSEGATPSRFVKINKGFRSSLAVSL